MKTTLSLSVFCFRPLLIAISVFYGGCSFARPNWEQFQALCVNPNQNFISKRVKAESYLRDKYSCAEDWRRLLDYHFEYCEGYQRKGATTTLLRHSIGLEGDPNCRTFPGWEKGGAYAKEVEGKCLLTRKIDQPTSKYMLVHETGVVDQSGRHIVRDFSDYYVEGAIIFYRHQIVDRATKEIIAQKVIYNWFKHGGRGPPAPAPLFCDKSDMSYNGDEYLFRVFTNRD